MLEQRRGSWPPFASLCLCSRDSTATRSTVTHDDVQQLELRRDRYDYYITNGRHETLNGRLRGEAFVKNLQLFQLGEWWSRRPVSLRGERKKELPLNLTYNRVFLFRKNNIYIWSDSLRCKHAGCETFILVFSKQNTFRGTACVTV